MISIEEIRILKKHLPDLLKKSDYKTYNALFNLLTDYLKITDNKI